MPTNTALLIDLAGVARLADVQRPVASMWRTRFAATDDPFPQAISEMGGRPLFDASQIAEWLARTDHGNNPDVVADAAAMAAPAGFSFSDAQAVAELGALIALYSQRGELEGLSPQALRRAARECDPIDEALQAECDAHAGRGAPWLEFAERLIDAAYSPAAALTLVDARGAASISGAGSAGPLANDATAFVVAAAVALVADAGPEAATTVTIHAPDVELAATVVGALGDEVDVALPKGEAARRVHRRLLAEGRWVSNAHQTDASRSITVARVPSDRADDVMAMLNAVDEIALSLRDQDAAIVIGPARALADTLDPSEEQLRAGVLRTGKVRGVARLAPGLVQSAPREALALWILGAPMGQVKIDERVTLVADLTDVALTTAARTDLVSDLVASLGSRGEVRAHSFRFARPVRTASLLARSGAIIESTSRMPATAHRTKWSAQDLPVLIDAAAEAVHDDLPFVSLSPASDVARPSATVAELIRDGHLRLLSGTRLNSAPQSTDGLVVVTASDLEAAAAIGRTRVDQFAFATQHPSAGLTRPGDVVFRTSPTAAAWVDVDGSKVVAYPARILRISASDPGGLVPELIAADITGQPAGPGAWKRWMLRRVPPHAITPLRVVLAEIAARRDALRNRAARLEQYAELLSAGVVAAAVALEPEPHVTEHPDTAVAAASTQ